MVERLLAFSLRRRGLVVLVWAVVAGLGVVSALTLPIDAFPDTTPVQVQVHVQAAALSPIEVERRATIPLEAELTGLPGVVGTRSVSKFGLASLTLTFADGVELAAARQAVFERLASVRLDPSVGRPVVGPAASGLGEVFHYLLRGAPPSELRRVQDRLVAPRLRAVPGVAEVTSWGGDERRIEVRVDPKRLARWQLGITQVVDAILDVQEDVGGAVVAAGGEATLVQGAAGPVSAADVAAIVVARRDVPVRVADVADVTVGREVRHGAVTARGDGEVVLGLGFALLGADGHAVTERLASALATIQKDVPRGVVVEPVYQRTTLVDEVLGTVETNLAEGALLVVLVLFVFLRSVRAGLIVAAVIPLAMLFAANLMHVAGIAGSLMSLGALDFGLLVDSAVIQVEHASRHALPRTAPAAERLAHLERVVLEVRKPTLYGEAVIAIVYLPILLLEGVEGKLFRPMAETVLFALLGSLCLSLTLVPALTSWLPPERARRRLVFDALLAAYRALVARLVRPGWALVMPLVAALALGGAAWLASGLGSEFVPRLSEGSLVVNTVRLASVDLEESVRAGTRVEALLRARFPDAIADVWTRTGSAELATDPMGVEVSDVFITLTPRARWTSARTQDELADQIRRALSDLPGMNVALSQPIEMRINEMVAGVRADLGVILHGDDYAALGVAARAIEATLARVPGATDVATEQLTGLPLRRYVVDAAAAARLQVAPREVLHTLAALGGVDVGVVREPAWPVPLAVTLDPALVPGPEALLAIPVATHDGRALPLGLLVREERLEPPSTITREDGRRRIVVSASVAGRDLGGFVAEARARIAAEVALPEGAWIRWGGQFEHKERAEARLFVVVPVALALVLLLLALAYGRAVDALRVFLGVPFAAVGGVVALVVADLPFSISAGVGFVALTGVAVLGDMVLVSAIRQRIDAGEAVATAVVAAAAGRLRPVLMTALVASLGFVPMALATGVGAEVQRPLATVVIGGVVSSTILTLLVLPSLFVLTRRRRA